MSKLAMQPPRTSNPAGNTVYRIFEGQTPGPSVAAKQDQAHTESDFLNDLDRATSNRAKERLAPNGS
jgi:hypothetical protein